MEESGNTLELIVLDGGVGGSQIQVYHPYDLQVTEHMRATKPAGKVALQAITVSIGGC